MGQANTLLHIRGVLPSLRPAEQRVANEILENPQQAVHMTISELGRRAQVSDATVVKFCKRLGTRVSRSSRFFSPRMWLPSPNQFTAKSNLLIL